MPSLPLPSVSMGPTGSGVPNRSTSNTSGRPNSPKTCPLLPAITSRPSSPLPLAWMSPNAAKIRSSAKAPSRSTPSSPLLLAVMPPNAARSSPSPTLAHALTPSSPFPFASMSEKSNRPMPDVTIKSPSAPFSKLPLVVMPRMARPATEPMPRAITSPSTPSYSLSAATQSSNWSIAPQLAATDCSVTSKPSAPLDRASELTIMP